MNCNLLVMQSIDGKVAGQQKYSLNTGGGSTLPLVETFSGDDSILFRGEEASRDGGFKKKEEKK